MLLDDLCQARRELLEQSSRPAGAIWLLSPAAYRELHRQAPSEWRNANPMLSVFGLPIAVTRHLPTGTDFVLLRAPELQEEFSREPTAEDLMRARAALATAELAGPRPLSEIGPAPERVEAKSWDDWLASTSALLEDCALRRR